MDSAFRGAPRADLHQDKFQVAVAFLPGDQAGASHCLPDRNQGGLLAGKENCHGHGSELNSSLALPCSSPPSSLPYVLPGPSLGPRTLSCPRPTLPPHSCLPKSLQPPQQGLPLIPPDSLRQHGTSKLQSLRPLLSSPNPGRLPLTGTTQLTLPPPRMLNK